MTATLALDATGRQVEIPHRVVTGVEAVATRVRVALEVVRGTWPTDVLLGLPWPRWFENPPLPIEVEGDVRRVIESDPDVLEVTSVTSQSVGDTLHVQATFLVASSSGSVAVTVGDSGGILPAGVWMLIRTQPFIVRSR